ncbi:MAG: VPS10 domain-containing protein [bacterium]
MKRTPLSWPMLLMLVTCAAFSALAAPAATAAEKAKSGTKSAKAAKPDAKPMTHADSVLSAETFSGLELRGIGPAQNSGRVVDIAIHPSDKNTWYVAAACGNVWKTSNAGTTWTAIFDDQGAFSIGCVTIDPNDPHIVWVGTGENNSQRSVAYGDGVYKSVDGGKSWENVGLKESEHIGKIVVDPRNSDVVYVAAHGPLWRAGGDRGLYKTTDGGATWNAILEIDEYTGVNEVVMDPRDPDVLIASAYQRHRRVWTLIDGGPGSGVHKSTDAGATWKKMSTGLPKEEMGRIGLTFSPADPNIVYAIVEAANKAGGFFRSRDVGVTWEKMSDYVAASPQYYNEIIADPKDAGLVYSMDTWMHFTEDGGKTFTKISGEKYKHVDNHALWIDPDNTMHIIAGCDGGVYESFDRCVTWKFSANLPITQFYKVAVDSAWPFYNVYGGTQDNNTLGGPTRTRTTHGITNYDWYITMGGDGFQTQVDPGDTNIVYSQAQHGVLGRFDKRTGEVLDVQPQGEKDQALRWNWDSPLIISPHSNSRLYFAANVLFRSDDRGDSWKQVGGDLTRQLDRNKLEIMGRVWSVDAVAKNASTSFYGNIVSLAESPLVEGLLYVGTDDGLVQVSDDAGTNWRRIERFAGVPDLAYVGRVVPSQHSEDVVYAAFQNYKMGDFKPYLLRSNDRGRSWSSVAGDLPERGTVFSFAEDHVDPNLLFAGTEFGVFFTQDGGKRWIQLKGGMPVQQVRDLAIQRRENDLVVGTFGRGFYILDDYSPLRTATLATLDAPATLFDVKPAWIFVPWGPLGLPEKASLGDAFFIAPNPPFGAVFTYYLRDELKSRKKERQEREKKIAKDGGDVMYPSWDRLREEAREEKPAIFLTVSDEAGNVVRRVEGVTKKGFHRVAWDLRFPPPDPVALEAGDFNPFVTPTVGPLAAPGRYSVTLEQRVDGAITRLAGPVSFDTVPLGQPTIPSKDRGALLAFQRKASRLQRAVLGTAKAAEEMRARIEHLKKAIDDTPGSSAALASDLRAIEARLLDVEVDLSGDPVLAARNESRPPGIADRIGSIIGGTWLTTSDPTATHRRAYDIAAEEFATTLAEFTALSRDLAALEQKADAAGAPWTPGRVPSWTKE